MDKTPPPEQWLKVTKAGLWCEPGGFYVDPSRVVDKAVITHGHGDHARPGHRRVLATPETLAIMGVRLGKRAGHGLQPLEYGATVRLGDVDVRLEPAGHILGSAQVVMTYRGCRVVVTGDFKRRADPTCVPFLPVSCDLLVTEATFGLPVFQFPDDRDEIARLCVSAEMFPERAHLIGVYALGKCQRLIGLLRATGYDRPVWIHPSFAGLCAIYTEYGVALGDVRVVGDGQGRDLGGEIVLCPPGAARGDWAETLPDPRIGMASGWLATRKRRRGRGGELPLVISDHADWTELIETFNDVGAPRIWVTHGREDALIHAAIAQGRRAEALASFAGTDA